MISLSRTKIKENVTQTSDKDCARFKARLSYVLIEKMGFRLNLTYFIKPHIKAKSKHHKTNFILMELRMLKPSLRQVRRSDLRN